MRKQTWALSTALGLLLAAALPAAAQEPGEQIHGVITAVELQGSAPRSVTLQRDDGSEMTVTIANRTRVSFQAAGYENADLNYLKPGLGIRFKYSTGPLDRIIVTAVPGDYEPPKYAQASPSPTPRPAAAASERRVLKVRILEGSTRRGTFQADVAGRSETFRVSDASLLRRFRAGDLVVLTLEVQGGEELVTKIDSAAVSGRVTRVDWRRKEVTVDVDGRDEVYTVEDEGIMRDLRVGDRILLESEDRRGGRRVITSISR